MKRKSLITIAAVFGVFILVNTSLLAQSTKKVVVERKTGEVKVSPQISIEGLAELEEMAVIGYGDFDGFAYTTSSSEKNSKLTLSKRYDGETTSKTGTFSVESGVKKSRLSISGSVNSGKISLELYIPGKKELKKLTIDDSADIHWSQSININEGNTKYYGEWTYVINAREAKGRYSLSLSTY